MWNIVYLCVKIEIAKMAKYEYDYPRPALTADCVVFGLDGDGTKVLLIERGQEPCKGKWAFPGGFMQMDETAEECAVRELEEETGLRLKQIRQVGAYSGVDRDPRGRVVTVAYYALTSVTAVKGSDDAARAQWFALDKVPPLAFDHDLILRHAIERMQADLRAGKE